MSRPETALLKKIPLFDGLDQQQLEKVAAVCRKKDYGEGDVLIREGEQGDEMFVVMEGKVGISRRIATELPGGEKMSFEKKLAVLDAGSYFGELAMLENDVRSATVRAESPLRTLVIKSEKMQALMEKDVDLGFKVLKAMSKVMCRRLRKSNADIAKLMTAFALAVRR